jgi:hypothetical protein
VVLAPPLVSAAVVDVLVPWVFVVVLDELLVSPLSLPSELDPGIAVVPTLMPVANEVLPRSSPAVHASIGITITAIHRMRGS